MRKIFLIAITVVLLTAVNAVNAHAFLGDGMSIDVPGAMDGAGQEVPLEDLVADLTVEVAELQKEKTALQRKLARVEKLAAQKNFGTELAQLKAELGEIRLEQKIQAIQKKNEYAQAGFPLVTPEEFIRWAGKNQWIWTAIAITLLLAALSTVRRQPQQAGVVNNYYYPQPAPPPATGRIVLPDTGVILTGNGHETQAQVIHQG